MIWVVTNLAKTKEELVPLVESRGYQATYVDCVENVHEDVKVHKPELLVLDCGVKSSLELVTTMRGDPKTLHIPVIVFAVAKSEHCTEAMARGADAFVEKRSLDWAELFTHIVRLAGPPAKTSRPTMKLSDA